MFCHQHLSCQVLCAVFCTVLFYSALYMFTVSHGVSDTRGWVNSLTEMLICHKSCPCHVCCHVLAMPFLVSNTQWFFSYLQEINATSVSEISFSCLLEQPCFCLLWFHLYQKTYQRLKGKYCWPNSSMCRWWATSKHQIWVVKLRWLIKWLWIATVHLQTFWRCPPRWIH